MTGSTEKHMLPFLKFVCGYIYHASLSYTLANSGSRLYVFALALLLLELRQRRIRDDACDKAIL